MVAITLLLYGGTKVPLEIDDKILSKVGFSGKVEDFSINDLVDYLFTYWNEIFNDAGIERPVYISQIQLIYLGARLQPEARIGSLSLNVSSILHLILKPVDMVRAHSDSNNASKKGIIQKFMKNSAMGKARGANSELVYTKRSQENNIARVVTDGTSSRKETANDNEEQTVPTTHPNIQAETETSSTEGPKSFPILQDSIALEDLNSAHPDRLNSSRLEITSNGTRTLNGQPPTQSGTLDSGSGGCCVIV